jgi:hypothetical protein
MRIVIRFIIGLVVGFRRRSIIDFIIRIEIDCIMIVFQFFNRTIIHFRKTVAISFTAQVGNIMTVLGIINFAVRGLISSIRIVSMIAANFGAGYVEFIKNGSDSTIVFERGVVIDLED